MDDCGSSFDCVSGDNGYDYCDCDPFSDATTGYACDQTSAASVGGCDEGFIAVANTDPYNGVTDIGDVVFATCVSVFKENRCTYMLIYRIVILILL